MFDPLGINKLEVKKPERYDPLSIVGEEYDPLGINKPKAAGFDSSILPTMPSERPDEIVSPKTQMSIYGLTGAIQGPIRQELQERGIEAQRAKRYGTISELPFSPIDFGVGFIKNIPSNIENIVKETGSLLLNLGLMAKNAVLDHNALNEQLKPATELVGAIKKDWSLMLSGKTPEALEQTGLGKFVGQEIQEAQRMGFKGYAKHMAGWIEEHPVDSLLLGQVVKAAAGAGVRGAAQTATRIAPKGSEIANKLDSFLSTERTPIVFELPSEKLAKGVAPETTTQRMVLDVEGKAPPSVTKEIDKKIEFERKYSGNPFDKYVFQKSFDGILNKFPKLQDALATGKANKLLDKMRLGYENATVDERIRMHGEILTRLNRLSKDELKIMVPYLEGRASIIGETSSQFKEFEDYYRKIQGGIQDDLVKSGALNAETIKERLYQPIASATGQTTEQVMAELGDFTPAYAHHTFPQTFAQKAGIQFADTTAKRFAPSFLKRSQGVGGYSEDMKIIMPKMVSEYIKFKNTEAFLNDFTNKFGIPVNLKDIKPVSGGVMVGDKLYKGYKIVAPDGYLRFYKGNVDLYRETIKKLDEMDFDEALSDTLKNALLPFERPESLTAIQRAYREAKATGEKANYVPMGKVKATLKEKYGDTLESSLGGKSYISPTKDVQVYLVPDNIAERLNSFATPRFGSQQVHNFLRVAYDRPVGVWKDTVLATTPRWIKNNLIGNIIFDTMEGVGPLSYGRSFTSKYKELIPDELIKASFSNVMKYNPQLGNAAKSTVGKFVKALEETSAVKGLAKVKDFGYALNTMFEQPFSRSLYVKIAREKAIDMLKSSKVPVTEESILSKMLEIKQSKQLSEPLINKVKQTMPVFEISGPFERKYMKMVAPFYNWYKFMIQYSARLPVNHPFKTVGARGLGALSEKQREEAFKQYFPWMSNEIDKGGIPDRYDNLWPVKGEDEDGKAVFFNARGFNVFTTVEDAIKGEFVNMMSPIIKVPLERAQGKEAFTGREFKTGERGVGEYKEFDKQNPPLLEHILSQLPHYKLLKQTLVPAKQYDAGTVWNPDPIVDKITGEYKYPIESVEKWLNYIGIDKYTLDIRKTWDAYLKNKRQAVGETFSKYQSKTEMALSLDELKEIFNQIKRDGELWNKIIKQTKQEAIQKAKEQIKIGRSIK
jgi:hypothetical protein